MKSLNRSVVAVSLVSVFSAGSALGQFDGLKDRLKKKAEEAVKEVEKHVTGEGEGAKEKQGSQKDGEATPAETPKPGAEGSGSTSSEVVAEASSAQAGALSVQPSRVVPLGTLPADVKLESVVFSPLLDRAAWVGRSGSRQAVFVNGKAGPAGDEVVSGIAFSPDGATVAYVLRRGDLQHLVVNDQVGEGIEHINRQSLVFSASGARVAASGFRQAAGGKNQGFVCVDGALIGPLSGIETLRFVGEELAYAHWINDEEQRSPARQMVYGEERVPVRLQRLSYHSDSIEHEQALGTAIGVMLTDEGGEQLWIGKPVGPVVRDIRGITIAPDGSNWGYIADVADSEGDTTNFVPVVVVGGQIVLRLSNVSTQDALKVVDIVFADRGSGFALVRKLERGMRVEHAGRTDAEYGQVGYLRLSESGDLSYWAQKDGYVYRVNNGEESEGIRGRIDSGQGRSMPLVMVPGTLVRIEEAVIKEGPRGSHEFRVWRVAVGDEVSPQYEHLGNLAVSGNGLVFGGMVTSPAGKAEGCWLLAGPHEIQLSNSISHGFNGHLILDETGEHSVFVIELRHQLAAPTDIKGGKANLTHDLLYRSNHAYAILRDGVWQADLYGGRPAGRFAAVRGIAFTPDTRNTLHWLGTGDPESSESFSTNLNWTLYMNGRPIACPPPAYAPLNVVPLATNEPETHPSQTYARAGGAFSADGSVYRYVANESGALSLVEFTTEDLVGASR